MIIDTVGFVSATYMRGIPYTNVPTTLLAQIDSSIGGKVAVNHPKGKNLIGSFYQPIGVYIYPELLKTLSIRDIRSGLAEIIKTAIISSEELFNFIENNLESILSVNSKILFEIIMLTSKLKTELLSNDLYEKDLKRPLNFGHEIEHAIEKVEGYKNIRNGEAVAIGMCVATKIGEVVIIQDILERDVVMALG